MALNFPDAPTANQVFTAGNASWIWDTAKWVASTMASPLPVVNGGTGANTPSGALSNLGAAPSMSSPVGMIQVYAGSSAPTGWQLCNGQAISRTVYAALYAVVGTTYGAGDGSTTFNVPDLRGRTVFGLDAGANRLTGAQTGGLNANALGASGGEQGHTSTSAETAVHAHSFSGTTGNENQNHNHSGNSGAGIWLSAASSTVRISTIATGPYNLAGPSVTDTEGQAHNHNFSGSTDNGPTGGAAHNNVPPGLALNYIIYAGA
jgi:microcystin-dependent protein